MSIREIKFEDITVIFHSRNATIPTIEMSEKKQLASAINIQDIFLKIINKTKIINNKTPKPKINISFFTKVIVSSAIIGIPPKYIFKFDLSLFSISCLISIIF